jgi:hypothetical protein
VCEGGGRYREITGARAVFAVHRSSGTVGAGPIDDRPPHLLLVRKPRQRPIHMRHLRPSPLLCCIVLIAVAAPATAQNDEALRALEGTRVVLKIDMPATAEGIDVRADARQAVDFRAYGDRLKKYGAAIRSGEPATITLIKVKKDLIEVQLNGGGFGTFGDDTSSSVNVPLREKSEREKDLEKQIKSESDARRKRQMQDDLNDLRDRRERENRRLELERVRAEEQKKERIAAQRLVGGSRFNLRYEDAVPAGIRPADLIAALGEYVDFSRGAAAADSRAAPRLPPDDLPRKGMTRDEAERLFGRPVDVSERREGRLDVSTLTFVAGDRRITAEFVEDVLIRYTIASR